MSDNEAQRVAAIHGHKAITAIMRVALAQPILAQRLSQIASLYSVLQSDEEIILAIDLLERGKYYDSTNITNASALVAQNIVSHWKLSPKNTCLVARDLEEKTSSADAALQFVRTALDMLNVGWSGSNMVSTMDTAVKATKWENIVLVDDFIGTGNKVSKKIEWLRSKETKKHKIFVTSLVRQNASIATISSIVDGYYSADTIGRGMSDHYHPSVLQEHIQTMEGIEQRFGSISDAESLGYEQSEAFFQFSGKRNMRNPRNSYQF